jgi:hypothetical protein
MSIKRLAIFSLLVFPAVFIICSVVYRRHHPAAISYTQQDWSATATQVAKTITDWNSLNPQDYVEVSDTLKIKKELEKKLNVLAQNHSLSSQQADEAETSFFNLIESLYNRNYEQFISARIPSKEFVISDWALGGLHRFSRLKESANPLDHYKNVWTNIFNAKPLWSEILFDESNAIILRTNTTILKSHIEFPASSLFKGNAYVTSWPTVPFDYSNLQQKELAANNQLLLCSLFFMAKESTLEHARPFMLTFFWDSKDGVWIPFEFEHGFIESPPIKVRFF